MSATNGLSHAGLGEGTAGTTSSPDAHRTILVSSSTIRPLPARTERPAAPSGVLSDRPAAPSGLLSEPPAAPSGVLADPPAAPSGLLSEPPAAPPGAPAPSERLPRDVLVRLAALTRKVGDIRRDHATHAELSQRLDNVAADLDALVQGIYDGSVEHLAAPPE